MQNSIKISNELFGETTFSGGISTTNDKRLGAEEGSGGGSSGTKVKYTIIDTNGYDESGKHYTNLEIFDLLKSGFVIFNHKQYLYSGNLYKDNSEITYVKFTAQDGGGGVFGQITNLSTDYFKCEFQSL